MGCQIEESSSKWITNNETIYYLTFNIEKLNGHFINVWYEITVNTEINAISIKTNKMFGDMKDE